MGQRSVCRDASKCNQTLLSLQIDVIGVYSIVKS